MNQKLKANIFRQEFLKYKVNNSLEIKHFLPPLQSPVGSGNKIGKIFSKIANYSELHKK